MSNINDEQIKKASFQADAPTTAASAAGPETEPTGTKASRPMWNYVGALVLAIIAIGFAVQSYNWALHGNESWGGQGAEVSAAPKVSIDERIAKIKADKSMPAAAKARALGGLEYGRAMEAAHGH